MDQQGERDTQLNELAKKSGLGRAAHFVNVIEQVGRVLQCIKPTLIQGNNLDRTDVFFKIINN